MMENLSTIAITLITVLGSAGAWRYYEKKLDSKKAEELDYKYECKSRIDKLEFLLAESSKEKEEMHSDDAIVITESPDANFGFF